MSLYYGDYDDDDWKLLCIFRIFNLLELMFVMEDFLVVMEFVVVVYIIDKNNEISRSERRIFNMEEGGMKFLFYFLIILMM